jgi:hypothetical protein
MKSELIYRDGISPPGCACAACAKPFVDGERYSQRLAEVAVDVLVVEIVCWSCALGEQDVAAA